MRRAHGFTLIEILVAVAVLVIMTAAAYGGLNTLMKVREESRDQMQHFKHLQLAMVTLERDVAQAVPRPIRHASGDRAPGMQGSDKDVPVLAFTRGGRPDPLLEPRSGLERVAYDISDDKLVRYFYPVLDRTVEQEPEKQVLLDGVTALHVKFMDAFGQWGGSWPPLNGEPHQYDSMDPVAVSITLDTKRWGEIRRVIGVAP